MTREEIIEKLAQNHSRFATMLTGLRDEEYLFAPPGKWTAGQQAVHVCMSVKPLGLLRRMPRFMLRYKFGVANRPSRSYAELVAKYRRVLSEGASAPPRFQPAPVSLAERGRVEKDMLRAVYVLSRAIKRYPEKQLDTCILPHPVLGRLTLREMMYFTIYHVEHHHQSVLGNLGKPAPENRD